MAVSANRLELLQIADAVAREKSIDRQIVIDAMQDAIAKAAKEAVAIAKANSKIQARPVELAGKLPAQLAAPFEGEKATLKVALSLDDKLPPNLQVEGLPVTVLFD